MQACARTATAAAGRRMVVATESVVRPIAVMNQMTAAIMMARVAPATATMIVRRPVMIVRNLIVRQIGLVIRVMQPMGPAVMKDFFA